LETATAAAGGFPLNYAETDTVPEQILAASASSLGALAALSAVFAAATLARLALRVLQPAQRPSASAARVVSAWLVVLAFYRHNNYSIPRTTPAGHTSDSVVVFAQSLDCAEAGDCRSAAD
jgi:apolipoprotein N-acyltransferase